MDNLLGKGDNCISKFLSRFKGCLSGGIDFRNSNNLFIVIEKV